MGSKKDVEEKESMINRFLLSIGLAFLAFSVSSLFILIPLLHTPMRASGKIPFTQPGRCTGDCGGPTPIRISEASAAYGLVIEYEWPKHMDISDSDSISVALAVDGGTEMPSTPTPIGNVSDRGINSVNPSSLAEEEEISCKGDPRLCLISNIFGDGYKMTTAFAYMVTTAFDVQLVGSVERSTDQPLIEWDWNISPKSTGLQVISVGIDLQWTPTGKGGGTNILRQLWESPIAIEVDKPFINVGQLTLSTAVSGVFGTVFTGASLPWILEQWRQKQENKKKKIKFCRYCGAENPEDFEFCNKCGKQRATLTVATISTQPIPSSPRLTGDKQSSVGNTAILVQETPTPSSSKEDGK
jgi:ribosomal protein L40E